MGSGVAWRRRAGTCATAICVCVVRAAVRVRRQGSCSRRRECSRAERGETRACGGKGMDHGRATRRETGRPGPPGALQGIRCAENRASRASHADRTSDPMPPTTRNIELRGRGGAGVLSLRLATLGPKVGIAQDTTRTPGSPHARTNDKDQGIQEDNLTKFLRAWRASRHCRRECALSASWIMLCMLSSRDAREEFL